MKRAIAIRLCIVIIAAMLVTALLGYHLQVKSAKEAMIMNSELRFNQIAEILDKNDREIEALRENLKEDYFIRAKAAAYIVQNNPEVVDDLAEMRKIASLLQVDEFHLFDTGGRLYSGSEPKYYNYTFRSGEQMQFFLPMLENYDLQLCQEVTPNTAEGKMMQYAAVWREDHQGIVQIGMEPSRLMAAMEKNELSHIFSMMTTESGVTILAVDDMNGTVTGATDGRLVGEDARTFGLDLQDEGLKDRAYVTELTIGGERNYSVVRRIDQVIVGVCCTYDKLYENVPANMALIILSLFLLFIVTVFLIMEMLDRYMIRGIRETVEGTKRIAAGDLDYILKIDNLPEFKVLSQNINQMVKSLLEATGKLSLVFQNVNVPIAVYEYNQDMKRVLATSKLGQILMIPEKKLRQALENRQLFAAMIHEICVDPLEGEKDVYVLKRWEVRYIRVRSYREGDKTLGIVVDVTEEIAEKRQIELERDIDLLTGLLTRRAFYRTMDLLFMEPQKLQTAMIVMMDLDNLKIVNDTWGHECGDRLLNAAADIFTGCFQDSEVAGKVAARLSGDEFVLFLYGEETEVKLEAFLHLLKERIREAVLVMPDCKPVLVSISGGCVFYPQTRGSYKDLLKLADETMYRVKKSGKDRIERYDPKTAENHAAEDQNHVAKDQNHAAGEAPANEGVKGKEERRTQ